MTSPYTERFRSRMRQRMPADPRFNNGDLRGDNQPSPPPCVPPAAVSAGADLNGWRPDQLGDASEKQSPSDSQAQRVSPALAAQPEQSAPLMADAFPAPPGPNAHYGPAGDLVNLVGPQSEAD